MDTDIKDLRFYGLLCALLLYGIAGSPTPDNPGIIEAVVGILLIIASGPVIAAHRINPSTKLEYKWATAGRYLLIYGLSVPLITGLVRGNDTGNMLRDLFPFLFMMMPFFLHGLAISKVFYSKGLIAAAVFTGIAFSIRSQFPEGVDLDYMHFSPVITSEQLYLANAPTVLFTALLITGTIFNNLAEKPESGKLLFAAMLAVIAVMTIVAMAGALQRASMGMLLLMLCWLLTRTAVSKPASLLLPISALGALLLFLWPEITELWDVLARKTVTVGLNNRLLEGMAVIESLHDNAFNVIFGQGWGTTFSSPAVGDMSVNFTHNLFTSFWLKTGLAGVCLSALYLWRIASEIPEVWKHWPVAGFALSAPLLINTFLYASYKSIDFGVILLLSCVLAINAGKLHERTDYSNETGLPNLAKKSG
jgi:hypothetical protein